MPAATMVRSGAVNLFVLADCKPENDWRLMIYLGLLVVSTAAINDRVSGAVERSLTTHRNRS